MTGPSFGWFLFPFQTLPPRHHRSPVITIINNITTKTNVHRSSSSSSSSESWAVFFLAVLQEKGRFLFHRIAVMLSLCPLRSFANRKTVPFCDSSGADSGDGGGVVLVVNSPTELCRYVAIHTGFIRRRRRLWFFCRVRLFFLFVPYFRKTLKERCPPFISETARTGHRKCSLIAITGR